MKNKDFDAFRMMRDIRDKMSERYYKNNELMFRELSEAIKIMSQKKENAIRSNKVN